MLILVGIVIGFVVGLTGAGGALVAIPIFMQFFSMSLKEASVYSLIAVVIASLSNFYYQRKNAHLALATSFVVSSGIGSFLSHPYKNSLPDVGIAFMLSLIALYSLVAVWTPQKPSSENKKQSLNPMQTIVLGLLLGVLTTFTGLGGGVLMLPVLLKVYRLPQPQAVATSLIIVGLSSSISFLIQISKVNSLNNIDMSLIGLILGILVTSYFLKILIAHISLKTADRLRKIVFTLVVVLALAKIF